MRASLGVDLFSSRDVVEPAVESLNIIFVSMVGSLVVISTPSDVPLVPEPIGRPRPLANDSA